MEQQERPCHAALSTCMAQGENATAAGCQKGLLAVRGLCSVLLVEPASSSYVSQQLIW